MNNNSKIPSKKSRFWEKLLLLITLFIFFIPSCPAIIDLMGMQLTFENSSISGDVNFTIFDAASSGSIIYSENFVNNISDGKVDVMLGENTDLNLTYGQDYYMDIIANGTDLNFSDNDRQQFQSSIGNVTTLRLDINDTLTAQTLIPKENISYDLGSASKLWNNIYAKILNIGGNFFFVNETNVGIGTITPSEKLTLEGGNFLIKQNTPSIKGGVIDTAYMGSPFGIHVSGKYAYVTGVINGSLVVVDISDPTNPSVVSGVIDATYLSNPEGLYVSGKYAYVAGYGTNYLTVVDISNPSNLSVVGWTQNTTYMANPVWVYVSGKYAYVTGYGTDSLAVVDISDPTNPSVVGGIANTTYMDCAEDLYISGEYAYVIGGCVDALAIINISDPTNPTMIEGIINTTYMDIPTAIYVSNKYAYIAGQNSDSLAVVNISDPTNPTMAGGVIDATYLDAVSIYVSGKYAYVTGYSTDSLAVVDISDPTNPSVVGGIINKTYMDAARNVYVSGKYAYVVGANSNSLAVLDISGIDVPGANIGDLAVGTIDVWENMNIENNLYVDNGLNVGPGGIKSDGPISFDDNTLVTNLDKVGIGTTSPSATLEIAGSNLHDLNVSGLLYVNQTNVGIGTASPSNFTLEVAGNIGPTKTSNYSLGKVTNMNTMDQNLSNVDASFYGEAASDKSSTAVTGVGDVNGDGYDDFVIGAYFNDEAGSNAGQTYLILGKASGWQMDVNLSNADASFYGEAASDSSGTAVTGVGDVNADGYDDFVIGASGNDEGGSSAGQTYLILGKSSGWVMDVNLSNANASFYGEAASDFSGIAVTGAGDVNGDGYDDLVIGASLNDEGGSSAGQTYLILGKASGWQMDTDLANADASFYGEAASDRSGVDASGVGDVNRDGYDDLVIGADRNSEGGSSAGQTYLILGKASGWQMDVNLSNANASFYGEAASDESGYAVAGAGDVNGDGYDDFVIGAHFNDESSSNAGQSYLILGKSSGWVMDVNLSNANASFYGEAASDESGYAVAGAGDVNGDGYDDFVIGAYGNDESGSSAGQTYLILGKASGWVMDVNLSNSDASFWGEDASDESGDAIAGAGDVNGDGYDDFVIGALENSDGGSSAGQTYLILSNEIQYSHILSRHIHAASTLKAGKISIKKETISSNSQLYLDANKITIHAGLDIKGKVGIGTTTPSSKLEIVGNGGDLLNITNASSTILFVNGTSERVGIATSSPTHTLNVLGNCNITQDLNIGGDGTQRNITLYSPDGTSWVCGVDNSGNFSCS